MTDTTDNLLGNPDARAWAQEFCELFAVGDRNPAKGRDVSDFELMTTWFANAIETGRDAGARQAAPPPVQPPAEQPSVFSAVYWGVLLALFTVAVLIFLVVSAQGNGL